MPTYYEYQDMEPIDIFTHTSIGPSENQTQKLWIGTESSHYQLSNQKYFIQTFTSNTSVMCRLLDGVSISFYILNANDYFKYFYQSPNALFIYLIFGFPIQKFPIKFKKTDHIIHG